MIDLVPAGRRLFHYAVVPPAPGDRDAACRVALASVEAAA